VTDSLDPVLAEDLGRLAAALESLALPRLSQVDDRRAWVVRAIRSYLIPRILDPGSPLFVVFTGPTGAGKSTLLNSVTGTAHSLAGPLRPTTRGPVVICDPARAGSYGQIAELECAVVTSRAPILSQLTLVDTPDIDSTEVGHRAAAERMIDSADIVIHVNSVSRYGDLVPWEVLRRAHFRGIPVLHVLNRITSSSTAALSDYRSILTREGFDPEVIAIHEHLIRRGAQSIPVPAIQELRDALVGVVRSRESGGLATTRAVLDTVLAEAADLIHMAEIRTETAGETSARISAGLAVDVGRIASSTIREPVERLGIERLAVLGRRRLRTRGMTRRRLPAPESTRSASNFFRQSVSVAVGSDLASLIDEHEIDPSQTAGIVEAVHGAIETAIFGWWEDVGEIEPIVSSRTPDLTALLFAHLALGGSSTTIRDALRALVGRHVDPEPTLSEMMRLLAVRLAPVYSGVEYRLLARNALNAATSVEIDGVRVTVSSVIARSSFANA
jgi:energy-coupling factor transporter ATP-binding protein EcfA2